MNNKILLASVALIMTSFVAIAEEKETSTSNFSAETSSPTDPALKKDAAPNTGFVPPVAVKTDTAAPDAPKGQKDEGKAPSTACTLISISIPAFPNDKPATFSPTIKDNQEGLVAALADCNPKAEVAGFIGSSTKTARIKVTQDTTGQAYFKVPTDRLSRLRIQFYISLPDWKGGRYWTSGALGDRTEVSLQSEDEKKAGKVY
jgi:hypothetical protein